MEIKIEIGKGQFRWRLLVFVFFTCSALVFPLAVYLNPEDFNFVAGILAGLILAILVSICVLLQKNWPTMAKCVVILFVLLYFMLPSQMFLVLTDWFIGSVILLIPLTPMLMSFLFYRFILKFCHKRYDKIEVKREVVEYKIISVRREIMLWAIYFGLTVTTIIFGLGTFVIILGVPGQSADIEYHRRIVSLIPLFPFIISPLLAIPAQRSIYKQEGWSKYTKTTNIIKLELVFIGVGVIVALLSRFLFIYSFSVIPFIPLAGGALLRYIFLKSSEGRIDRGE